MPASLTAEMSVKGPQVLLSALTKHYFGKLQENESTANEELLYASAFRLFKSFLEASSKHTVEELQEFSNIRTPSPYWIHSPRVLVPLVCCEQASKHLITALGGEEVAKKTLGGIKWWQVRGIKGVDCQWIALSKDWQEAKRRRREHENIQRQNTVSKKGKEPATEKPTEAVPEPDYTADMDEMRCMLYLHGGGFYFGSIDQQRYVMQRYARKINGRVFAVNYRKAPQYPFPCPLQDAIAAYIFLIQPPEGAKHKPIPPSSIVIAGDSAGGNLALTLLQVIRDSGLPPPAGGILVSPWCDLTHSFPSIHENTATDIIPPTGLSMHKPSLLWPPPNEEVVKTVRYNLAEKIRRLTRIGNHRGPSQDSISINTRGDVCLPSPGKSSYGKVGMNASMTHLKVGSGNDPQSPDMRPSMSAPIIPNLNHAEPADTFTIRIGDSYYQVKSQIQLYTTNNLLNHPLVSPINGYLGGLPPLYVMAGDKEVLRDEIIYMFMMKRVHVLPFFTFTTPAKFAFRSVAAFCKHVIPDKTLFTPFQADLSLATFTASPTTARRQDSTMSRSSSFRFGSFLSRKNSSYTTMPASSAATDVGPRFQRESADGGPGTAGYEGVYKTSPLSKGMLRERVSTKGVVRELEPEDELPAMEVGIDVIGMVNEISVKRYLDAQTNWEKRFKDTQKTVAKQRKRNIDAGEAEDTSRFSKLKAAVLSMDKDDEERNKIINSSKWSWAWVTDENPPPSSIVARRDTAEARRLSKIADQMVEEKEGTMSGNNLWAMIVNALTSGPEHTMPKSPVSPKSPTMRMYDDPPSPPRSIFRASGLRSTSSLATSISNDVVRIRRPSFGSLRIGRNRYLDANGEPLNQRQSIVPELPPALPSVGGIGRDDTFSKLALEGIAEVRVSEDSTHTPAVDQAKAKVNGSSTLTVPVPNGHGHTTNGLSPGGTAGSTGNSMKRGSSLQAASVKRKAIPAQLFEEAGIDPAQSPYASKESLSKHSNSSQPKLAMKEGTTVPPHVTGSTPAKEVPPADETGASANKSEITKDSQVDAAIPTAA